MLGLKVLRLRTDMKFDCFIRYFIGKFFQIVFPNFRKNLFLNNFSIYLKQISLKIYFQYILIYCIFFHRIYDIFFPLLFEWLMPMTSSQLCLCVVIKRNPSWIFSIFFETLSLCTNLIGLFIVVNQFCPL